MQALPAESPLATTAAVVWSASSKVEATVKPNEFGVEGPRVTIIGQFTGRVGPVQTFARAPCARRDFVVRDATFW
jgi:hypothetical protein